MYPFQIKPSQKRPIRTLGARVASLAMLTAMLSAAAHGQFRASIQGTVTDPDGSTIAGANLTLIDLDTNRTLTATSKRSLPTTSSSPPSPPDSSNKSLMD